MTQLIKLVISIFQNDIALTSGTIPCMIWTNADRLLIAPYWSIFSWYVFKNLSFLFKEMLMKFLSMILFKSKIEKKCFKQTSMVGPVQTSWDADIVLMRSNMVFEKCYKWWTICPQELVFHAHYDVFVMEYFNEHWPCSNCVTLYIYNTQHISNNVLPYNASL